MILYRRVKSQGASEKEHDFITILVQHILHKGIDISKSNLFSLTL